MKTLIFALMPHIIHCPPIPFAIPVSFSYFHYTHFHIPIVNILFAFLFWADGSIPTLSSHTFCHPFTICLPCLSHNFTLLMSYYPHVLTFKIHFIIILTLQVAFINTVLAILLPTLLLKLTIFIPYFHILVIIF